MSYALGLDLGTTYTAAAVTRDGRCEISPLGNRAAVIPSMVHLGPDGTVVVGEAAQRRVTTDPTRVAREFKRRFGDPTPLLLAGTPIAAESLTAKLARAVVDAVIEREGALPGRITVTHPATWGPFKLDLLAQAMHQAQLVDVSLLTEPEAAAWEYAASRPLDPGATVAVYDLGGGTFDATVLQATGAGFELLGEPEGIERLGGIDIDQAVFAFVTAALDGTVEALDPDDPVAIAALARLRTDCVEAKEALSSDHEASVPVVLPTAQTEVRITRTELETLIRPVLGDTVAAMERALRSASRRAADLDAVLLVGGSSRIPMVGQMVGELVGRPVAIDAHPKHLVAVGAARHAGAGGVLVGSVGSAAPPASNVAAAVAPPVGARSRGGGPPDPAPPASEPDPAGEPARSGPAVGPRRRGKVWALVAALLVVVLAAGVAVALLGDGDGDEDLASDAAAPAPDCATSGPFVCITSVRQPEGEGLAAEFVPVGFEPVEPGGGRRHLVFFLADVVRTDHGVAAVASGAPIEWGSSRPFIGWSAGELADRGAVCALVVQDGAPLRGSGNCQAIT